MSGLVWCYIRHVVKEGVKGTQHCLIGVTDGLQIMAVVVFKEPQISSFQKQSTEEPKEIQPRKCINSKVRGNLVKS